MLFVIFVSKLITMKNTLTLGVLIFLLASCGNSASEEADKARNEVEAQEKIIEAERQARERENSERANENANKKKVINAEIDMLEANGNRSKEQEARLEDLKKQLDELK